MKTNVKSYTDKELLIQAANLPSFQGFPTDYWILGVQSNEDEYNVPDDKFYIFKGINFVMVTTGTTNSGAYGMKNFFKWNRKGVFVVKTNEWYENLWANGKHKKHMNALVQVNDILGYRDGNKNKKIEEIGKTIKGKFGINFHGMSYKYKSFIKWLIGGWSVGCQVCNVGKDYHRILRLVKNQKRISYCLLKEF